MSLSLNLKMNREEKFSILLDAVSNCRLCPRLSGRSKVLSRNNGNINSNIMFIAEAPGRLGADRTNVPLFGDLSGNTFQRLLNSIAWRREDIFITNAVLCNPRDECGNNDTPEKLELFNCSLFLKILIDIIDPEYVITLGQTALESLKIIEAHSASLAKDVQRILPWHKRYLIPLYHTSPRAMIRRGFYEQLEDFYFLKSKIKLTPREKSYVVEFPFQQSFFDNIRPTKLQKLIVFLLRKMKRISKFKLTKLIYLIDYESLKSRKKLLTDAYYIKAPEGPLQTNLTEELFRLEGKEIRSTLYRGKPYVEFGLNPRFKADFENPDLEIIDKVLQKYITKNEKELKTAVYLTTPVRRLLHLKKVNDKESFIPLFTLKDFDKTVFGNRYTP